MGYSVWGCKESETLSTHAQTDRLSCKLEAARSRPWEKQSRQRPERRGLAVSEDLRGCHRSWVPAGQEQIMKDKGFPAAATQRKFSPTPASPSKPRA